MKVYGLIPVGSAVVFFLLTFGFINSDVTIRATVLNWLGWTQAQWETSGTTLLIIASAVVLVVTFGLTVLFGVISEQLNDGL